MRWILLFTLSLVGVGGLWGQQSAEPVRNKVQTVLFVYEERNEKIDPWLELFRKGFQEKGFTTTESTAQEAATANLSKYDLIILYGAVMAFTAKEPLRDWLSRDWTLSKQSLAGMKVGLFVTANRWFLKEYDQTLRTLLKAKECDLVDAVSAATEGLKEAEKTTIVQGFLDRVKTP